jgi:hypothetical protein
MRGTATRNETKQIRNDDEHLLSMEPEMPTTATYLQNCPVCGRPLLISREYRGRRVHCRHCSGRFKAIDPASPVFAAENGGNALLRRADQLLNLCARKRRCAVAS